MDMNLMMEKVTQICRFCLEIVDDFHELPDQTSLSQILRELPLRLNHFVTGRPIACNYCYENFTQSIGFKAKYDSIDHLSHLKKANLATNPNMWACHICMKIKKHRDVKLDQNKLEECLEKYLPSYNSIRSSCSQNTTSDSICPTCFLSLQNLDSFVKICTRTEDDISRYCASSSVVNLKGKVDLLSVIQFLRKNKENEDGSGEVQNFPEIKTEIDIEEHGLNFQNIDIKSEKGELVDDLQYRYLEDSNKLICRTCQNLETCTCVLTIIKLELPAQNLAKRHRTDHRLYKCSNCTFESRYKHSLLRHAIKHKQLSEVDIFQCHQCRFQTKFKQSLVEHHQLIHMSPSKIAWFKCDDCSFQTKLKRKLDYHSLLHRDASEVPVYKCKFCSFTSKFKAYIAKHTVIHTQYSSDLPSYKCNDCQFQTTIKRYLKKHLLVHRSPSKMRMFNCEECPFKTKFKYSLKKHSIVHKSRYEVDMYSCDLCSYETKFKYSFKRHGLIHKASSDIQWLRCPNCFYKSRYKANIKKHGQKCGINEE